MSDDADEPGREPGREPVARPSFEAAVSAAKPVAGSADEARLAEALDDCRRLVRLKLAPEAAAPELPALLVVAGGTNVGKTSLANAITGLTLGRPTALARATKAATAAVAARDLAALEGPAALPWFRREATDAAAPDAANLETDDQVLLLLPHEVTALEGLAVCDSPDMDSVLAQNQRTARDLLYAADAVLYVTSEEKYNDEACVDYLRRALRHRKRLLCVLNKHESDEVRADFEGVVREAAADAGVEAPPVIAVPFVPAGARDAGLRAAVEGLRGAVVSLAAEAAPLRVAARAGAAAALLLDAAPIIDSLRAEAQALARYRAAVAKIAADARAAYRAGLDELPVLEYQRVFKLLADALKVPVIDDVYARLQQATRPIGSAVRRFFNLKDPHEEERRVLAQRDQDDQLRAERCLGEALAKARRLPEAFPGSLEEPLRRALLGTDAAAALGRLDEDYGASIRSEAEQWVDEVLRDLHKELRERPGTVAIAKGLKGVLRVGAAAGAIVLTGHVGLEDLIVAPAIDLLVNAGSQKLVAAYFERKKLEFYDRRAAVFGDLAAERVRALTLARLPAGPDVAAVNALERAVRAAAEPSAGVVA